ncbi:glucose dehydrogenase, partial [Caerostris extrusa]
MFSRRPDGSLSRKIVFDSLSFFSSFHMLMLSLSVQKQAPKTKTSFKSQYDYIIVGGGAAGSVLASRLSEVPCVSVLLLEAGKPAPRVTDIPSVAGSFIQSDIDWKYRTTPQKTHGISTHSEEYFYPREKYLEAAYSTINALIMNRGHRRNYDEWAALGPQAGVSMKCWHGFGGPVSVERPNYQPEKDRIAESALGLGYRFVDVNGPNA